MPSIIAHLLHVFFSETHVSGLAAVLFSHHAGSVVLNCGHTPGQHAQYHYTPAAEVQLFFLSWLMALPPPNTSATNKHVQQQVQLQPPELVFNFFLFLRN